MQLTDEQFATLAPYEAHFTTALRSSYPRSPGRLALKTIHSILRELEPTTPALNTTCGTCILRVLKKAGTLYFEKKERDAAQDALAVLATKEAAALIKLKEGADVAALAKETEETFDPKEVRPLVAVKETAKKPATKPKPKGKGKK